jgi:hypothetical protein
MRDESKRLTTGLLEDFDDGRPGYEEPIIIYH